MWIGDKYPKDNKIRLHFFPNTWWVKFCAAIGCFYVAYEMIEGHYKTTEIWSTYDIINPIIHYLSKEPISWMAPLLMVGLGLWCLFLALSDLSQNNTQNKQK
jgi:hypothetical protein